ncbi:MAG: hypothetical protein CL877_01590 [Dehalococcoidales bacterium]|nr:hypothetical protein [Dehalococcoidales bacterium]HJO33512.1 type II secretion system F family protein [Anaerolineales bacterium]
MPPAFPSLGIALLVGVAVGFMALAARITYRALKQSKVLRGRLGPLAADKKKPERLASQAAWLTAWLSRRESGQKLIAFVRETGAGLTAGRFLIYILFSSLAAFGIGLALTGSSLAGFAFGAMGAAMPYMWLTRKSQQRLDRMLDQLPEALTAVGNALSAGAGVIQALEQAATEIAAPIQPELKKVVQDIKVGQSLEEALVALKDRVPLSELDSVVAAILIQQRSGGDLADLLREVVEMVREEVHLKQELRVQTAQAQLSARIMGVLPTVMFCAIFLMNPEFLAPLVSTGLGRLMLGIGFIMQVAGFMVIQRIAVIRV